MIRVVADLTQQLSSVIVWNVTASDGRNEASTNLSITIIVQTSISSDREQWPTYRFNITENTSDTFLGRILYPRQVNNTDCLLIISFKKNVLSYTVHNLINNV